MLMLNDIHCCHKTLFGTAFSPTLKPNPLSQQQQHYHPSAVPFSLPRLCCTNKSSSDSPSSFSSSTPFALSYLIHNVGFSPESAKEVCSSFNLRFKTAKKPDLVLSVFKKHGFSDSQIQILIRKEPWLLSCDPYKRLLPKFEFLRSIGASTSDIVYIVNKCPNLLRRSLENRLVPAYESVYRILQCDKSIIRLFIHNPVLFGPCYVAPKIRMLSENGVKSSSIAKLLQTHCRVFHKDESNLLKMVKELKDFGFPPSQSTFAIALAAKLAISETKWKKKVDAYKKWGWSDEDILKAFKRDPLCMSASVDKINLLMSYWVNQLGWDSLAIAKGPVIITLSLERRIIPRAAVLQFLLKKGLREKNASLTAPFIYGEDLFIHRFIERHVEESSHLLKLYEEKLDLAYTRDKADVS